MAYISRYSGEDLDNAVDLVAQMRDIFYPVGSIYTSTKSTSPVTLFGGTWTQIKDRFLLCAGDSYAAGATSGSATHTSAAHTHTTAGHTLTVNEMPAHSHYVAIGNSMTNLVNWLSGQQSSERDSWGYSYSSTQVDNNVFAVTTGGSASHSHGNTGSTTPGATGATSSLPPYKVIYAWERTA